MNVIKRSSTNGRWGIEIIMPDGVDLDVRGSIKPLGRRAGFECFEVTPEAGALDLVALFNDAEVVAGPAVTVTKTSLQSSNEATLVLARPGAIVQSFGYKRRSSIFYSLNSEYKWTETPTSVLLAAGLIKPKEPPAPIPEIVGFEESSPVLEALKKAGIVS